MAEQRGWKEKQAWLIGLVALDSHSIRGCGSPLGCPAKVWSDFECVAQEHRRYHQT